MVSNVALSLMLAALTATKNVTFEILNKEPGPIWVGIQGDPGHPHLNNGGVSLEQGKSISITAPGNWTGRFWPRTWCDPTTKRCRTGSCGDRIECHGEKGEPPYTLLEFDLKGWKGLDYYYITLEEGYNLRASIEPIDGEKTPGDPDSCVKVSCLTNINQHCANELKVEHSLQVIACKSACIRHETDLYCCQDKESLNGSNLSDLTAESGGTYYIPTAPTDPTGKTGGTDSTGIHDRPETCKNKDWPIDYATTVFKKQCPDAYSYKFDETKRIYTCKASHYRIQFGNINI